MCGDHTGRRYKLVLAIIAIIKVHVPCFFLHQRLANNNTHLHRSVGAASVLPTPEALHAPGSPAGHTHTAQDADTS